MKLPQTPLKVVFKNNRQINKAFARDLPMIKGSTLMRDLPLNTLIVISNKYCTSFRYVGNNAYSYAEWYIGKNGGYITMSGGLPNLDLLNGMTESVNRLTPFVSKLFDK